MEVTKIIAELRKERDQVEEAIISLERLARSSGARRGRPPAWLAAAKKGRRRAPGKKKGAAAKAVAAMAP
jgi:ribosomal protein L19E